MQSLGGKDVRPDRLDQGHERRRRRTDPIRQRRDVELDALAGVDRALPGQRQVLAVLGGQHECQQVRAGPPAGDRVRGGRRLADRLARPAADLLAHVLDHLPAPRLALERLGDVLTQLAHRATAPWAAAWGRVEDALAGQVRRERPAGGLARPSSLSRSLRCRGGELKGCLLLGGRLLKVGELELQLLDELRTPLGGAAVLLAAGLGQEQLQPLDLQGA